MITTPGLGLQDLPGKNCGACGFRSCAGLAERLENEPEMIRRCIQISENRYAEAAPVPLAQAPAQAQASTAIPETTKPEQNSRCYEECHTVSDQIRTFKDSLGRDFDFYLEHFPEDPGPREIVLPHNPMLTREMDVKVGDIMIGRPLGMSCGCPITHCGIVREVDQRTGVM
ncbi:MAG: (Fe-S)-binding protein, partial [Rhizomicrobium sp.]